MKSITANFPTLMFFRLNNVCSIQFTEYDFYHYHSFYKNDE